MSQTTPLFSAVKVKKLLDMYVKYFLIAMLSFYLWPIAIIVIAILIGTKLTTLERVHRLALLVIFAVFLKFFLYMAFLFPLLYEDKAIGNWDPLMAILFPKEYPAISEVVIRSRIEMLSRGGDPFGNHLIMIDGSLYSVGPSGVEEPYSVVYDPTNGTVSRGRVLVPYRKLK